MQALVKEVCQERVRHDIHSLNLVAVFDASLTMIVTFARELGVSKIQLCNLIESRFDGAQVLDD